MPIVPYGTISDKKLLMMTVCTDGIFSTLDRLYSGKVTPMEKSILYYFFLYDGDTNTIAEELKVYKPKLQINLKNILEKYIQPSYEVIIDDVKKVQSQFREKLQTREGRDALVKQMFQEFYYFSIYSNNEQN